MTRKYQVFVSSTYNDLKEERASIMRTLMEMDCIPAGMELFPATDEEQFEFIKRVIDDCDYYIILLGGRYGSLTQDGISFTEKEYDYAIETNKRVIALVHADTTELPVGKSERDPERVEKLETFRAKVMKGRLVKQWSDPKELPGIVAVSLQRTIRTYPGLGWVRGNEVDSQSLLIEIRSLNEENQALKQRLEAATSSDVQHQSWNSVFTDLFTLSGVVWYSTEEGKRRLPWRLAVTWYRILYILGIDLLRGCGDGEARAKLWELFWETEVSKQISSVEEMDVDDSCLDSIKLHLYANDLLFEPSDGMGFGDREWMLTPVGKAFFKAIFRNVNRSPDGSEPLPF